MIKHSSAFLFVTLLLLGGTLSAAELPVLKVGHVGHDHQVALFIAIEQGRALTATSGGIWYKEQKKHQVYDLMREDTPLARILLNKVRGGSGMPTALTVGEIEVGLGGVAATVSAIDKGGKLKIIAPCNCDGDMLVMRPDFGATSWAAFVEKAKSARKPIKIGYKAPRAVAYLIFKRALQAKNVRCGVMPVNDEGQTNQVMLVDLKGSKNMLPALASKVVDGFVMNQPVVAVAEENKIGVVVCDLRDLPPVKKWNNHPCCCVAATEKALRTKRELIIPFLQTLIAAGRYIQTANINDIARLAAMWTKKPLAVEVKSIPTVIYKSVPDKDWKRGMHVWFEMMADLKQFTKVLATVSPNDMQQAISDYTCIDAAQKKMPEK